MTKSGAKNDTLVDLRRRVVSLAASRFEKYYHSSTSTHIIRQLDGTEFSSLPIKGYGDFADDAYSNYLVNLKSSIANLEENLLRQAESRLDRYSPVAHKKVELQIELPTDLNTRLVAQAKARNVSLSAFINTVLSNALPPSSELSVVMKWYEQLAANNRPFASTIKSPQTLLTLPIEISGLVRLERLAKSIPQATVSGVLQNVILSTLGEPTVVRTQSTH